MALQYVYYVYFMYPTSRPEILSFCCAVNIYVEYFERNLFSLLFVAVVLHIIFFGIVFLVFFCCCQITNGITDKRLSRNCLKRMSFITLVLYTHTIFVGNISSISVRRTNAIVLLSVFLWRLFVVALKTTYHWNWDPTRRHNECVSKIYKY